MDEISRQESQERPARDLDDERDRDELRDRYYGLLQELRVLLPGVQILVAFLLTVPFAQGFDSLDDLGRALYGIALTTGVLAVVAFTTPTVLHRLGHRQARSQRLQWAIRTTRAGLALLAATLLVALALVTRAVFGDTTAILVTIGVSAAIVALWLVLPLSLEMHTGSPGGDD